MQKQLVVLAVFLVCLSAVLAGQRQNKRNRPQQQARDCGEWTEGQCIPKNNVTNCGVGTKLRTRTGDNCPVKEKTLKCKIPCAGEAAAGAGGRRVKSKAGKGCKYTKGQWSECDAATNTRTRTLTLKGSSPRRNAPATSSNCEPTKVQTKRCPPAGVGGRGNRGRSNGGQE